MCRSDFEKKSVWYNNDCPLMLATGLLCRCHAGLFLCIPKTMTWRPFLIRDSSLRPLMSYKASVISKYQVTIFLAPVFHMRFFFKLDGCCVPYHLSKQFATSTETLIFLWILQYDHPWNWHSPWKLMVGRLVSLSNTILSNAMLVSWRFFSL